MHDLDRTFLELGPHGDPSTAVSSEFWSSPPSPFAREMEPSAQPPNQEVFDEISEMEMAAELLGAQSEQEMENFLGGVLKKASRFAGKALHSTVGKEIVNQLKGVARTALPAAGAAVGNYLLPGVGGTAGRTLATDAGKALGLELEGMSPADQEFEVARRVVRLGTQAARQAAGVAPTTSDEAARVAQQALVGAAREVAPGLLRNPALAHSGGVAGAGEPGRDRLFFGGNGQGPEGERRTGRWVRQGNRIVLFGV